MQGLTMKTSFCQSLLAIAVAATASYSGTVSAQEITGAGASFPAPIYAKWASDYNKATGVRVNYQSIGSGGGIKQIDSKTVDFGASDMPLTDEVLKSKGQMQFPTVMGGVVPVINLEWIQKLHRDKASRGYSTEAVTDTILRRMPDYINYIVPQFTHTDINFQRVPTVDTSNPFIARWIPTPDESIVVIRFRDPHGIDFPYLLSMIHGSYMSRANSIVIPGGKLDLGMQLILTPLILKLVERRRRAI